MQASNRLGAAQRHGPTGPGGAARPRPSIARSAWVASASTNSLRPTSNVLAMNGAGPPHAQQLGDTADVLAIGLDLYRRERRLHNAASRAASPRTQPRSSQRAAIATTGLLPARSGSRTHQPGRRSEPVPRLTRDLGFVDDLALWRPPHKRCPFRRGIDPGIMPMAAPQ